jgi:hypothetical protein
VRRGWIAGCFTAIACVRPLEVAQPADVSNTTAAPFTLTAHDGSTVTLANVLAEHHVVLVFYRGHW